MIPSRSRFLTASAAVPTRAVVMGTTRPNPVNLRLRVWHERGIKEYVESSVWLAGRFIRISRRSSGI